MSSILTNNSAMVALQTLRSINNDLSKTQSMISTGKDVASAKDNSSVWAISKVMEADVKGFQGISDSLSLGQSTVAVARQASETVTGLLTEIKAKVVAAQESNVDRNKIQTDIDALHDQIGAVTGATQFNGLNLLSNTDTEANSGTIEVLSSLDRSDAGVAATYIDVGKQDLGDGSATAGTTNLQVGTGTSAAAGETVAYATLDGVGTDNNLVAGASFVASATGITDNNTGDAIDFDADVVYVARDGDSLTDVTQAMVDRLNVAAEEADMGVTFSVNGTTAGQIDITNNTGYALIDVDAAQVNQADIADQVTLESEADGTVGGGLEMLANIDITTDDGAGAALVAIESLIQTAIDSSASFGSVQGRLETQADFISGLTDALKSGIGSMVDANMEEASARLQALQVQQQLGLQSLSIANQAPQSIMSLFR